MTSANGVAIDLSEGERLKKEALDGFEDRGAVWLAKAREAATYLCETLGVITTDDVLAAVGMPEGIDSRIIGSVFRTGFVMVGMQKTARPSSHARLIGRWVLKEGR